MSSALVNRKGLESVGVKAVNGQKEPIEFAWNCSFSSCLFNSLKDNTSFIIGHRCVSNMYTSAIKCPFAL